MYILYKKLKRKYKIFLRIKKNVTGNSLGVQWLGLHAVTAKGPGSIPGQGTKIPHATWCGQKKNRLRKKKELYSYP